MRATRWRAAALAMASVAALTTAAGQAQTPAPAAATNDALALARQQNCLSCHAVHRNAMGPSFHDVAVKYTNLPDAAHYLERKIVDGSANVWGVVPMPANTQLSAEQARTLAEWIVTLR